MATSGSGRRPQSELGGILRRRREQLGLSMRETARRIDISPSYLFALEQGRNPSTGRAPIPSPPVLAAIALALDIDLRTLLSVSGAVPTSASKHLLLYQLGSGYRSALEAARQFFSDQVDAWIELVDPRSSGFGELPADDVLVRKLTPLSSAELGSHVFDRDRVLGVLADILGDAPPSSLQPRIGAVFGANSAVLRSVENPQMLLESERTWEEDVGAEFRSTLGAEPAANVCVYREGDIQELAARLDPLGAVLSLIQTHPHVAIESRRGDVTAGPAAIEAILASVRPAGVSSETWESLARAAAVGLARGGRTARAGAQMKGW